MSRNALFAHATWLDADRHHGYVLHPIPHDTDRRIAALLTEYMALPPDKNAGATGNVLNEDRALVLKAFAERMATQAVRTQDDNAVFLGFAALALCLDAVDMREVLIILALLHDAAWRLDVPPVSLIARLAPHFPDAAHALFRPFLARNPLDKSIIAMGFAAGTRNGAFAYVPIDPLRWKRLMASASEYYGPTRDARETVTRMLNLPATGHEQDWEIELADATRLNDILRALETTRDFEERCAIGLLLIASLEDAADVGPIDDTFLRRARTLIVSEEKLHDRMSYYWLILRQSLHPTVIDEILAASTDSSDDHTL